MFRTRGIEKLLASGSKSYDDVEQLLMQVGVIGAFLLSISFPLQWSVLPGTMDDADFFGVLCSSQQFRSYVVDRLEANNFTDWQLPYNINATLDVKTELLVHVRAAGRACPRLS